METANKNPRLLSSVLSGDELKRATMLSHFIVMRTRDKNGDKLRLLPSDMSAAYPLEFRPDGNKLISGEINF